MDDTKIGKIFKTQFQNTVIAFLIAMESFERNFLFEGRVFPVILKILSCETDRLLFGKLETETLKMNN